MTAGHSAGDNGALVRPVSLSDAEYLRRHRRARRSMTMIERQLFDAMFVNDKSYQQAARELGISDAVALHHAGRAVRIHCDAIAAAARPWWRPW